MASPFALEFGDSPFDGHPRNFADAKALIYAHSKKAGELKPCFLGWELHISWCRGLLTTGTKKFPNRKCSFLLFLFTCLDLALRSPGIEAGMLEQNLTYASAG